MLSRGSSWSLLLVSPYIFSGAILKSVKLKQMGAVTIRLSLLVASIYLSSSCGVMIVRAFVVVVVVCVLCQKGKWICCAAIIIIYSCVYREKKGNPRAYTNNPLSLLRSFGLRHHPAPFTESVLLCDSGPCRFYTGKPRNYPGHHPHSSACKLLLLCSFLAATSGSPIFRLILLLSLLLGVVERLYSSRLCPPPSKIVAAYLIYLSD